MITPPPHPTQNNVVGRQKGQRKESEWVTGIYAGWRGTPEKSQGSSPRDGSAAWDAVVRCSGETCGFKYFWTGCWEVFSWLFGIQFFFEGRGRFRYMDRCAGTCRIIAGALKRSPLWAAEVLRCGGEEDAGEPGGRGGHRNKGMEDLYGKISNISHYTVLPKMANGPH